MSNTGFFDAIGVVDLDKACQLLDCGESYLRELIKRGELESFLDGRARKVTVRSIRARQERLLKTQPAPHAVPPPPQPGENRRRRKSRERQRPASF